MCRAAPEAPFLNLAVSDAVSGPRTWEIGGPATTRRLQPGDIFLLDISTRCQGYFADTTRCFILDDPSAELQRMHRTLEEAVQAGQDAIRPGLRAGELDAIVRGVVHAAGYAPAHFPHHVGHGIGLAPQEDPWIVPDSDQVLEEGMVFTLEPGIYIPGVGGMRLEDNFVVTAGGCQALSHYPRRLTIVL
jgi:Xaa-Pro dipeptidase